MGENMRFVITEDLYNELLDRYCIEKSTSHRTEKVRKLVQCQAKDGSIYQAHRWVKIEKENILNRKISKEYEEVLKRDNDRILTNKDYLELSKDEEKELINKLNKVHYYKDNGILIAYGRKEHLKDKFQKEYDSAIYLHSLGYKVKMLPAVYSERTNGETGSTSDLLVNNVLTELKKITGTGKNAITNNGGDALDQGENAFLYVTGLFTKEEFNRQLGEVVKHSNNMRRKHGKQLNCKIMVRLEKENKTYLYNINKNGIANIDNPFSVSNSNRTIE